MFQSAKRLGEVKEYYFSVKLREIKRMNEAGKEVINLGIGSPDLPPAPEVIEELSRQSFLSNHHGYQSYTGIPELRQAFANWYETYFGVTLNPTSEILPLIGSKEGIMHISMTYLERGDEVLVPNPGYPAYSAVANLTQATSVHYHLVEKNGWMPPLEELADRDLSKVKLMWVNYPNMPTGKRGDYRLMERLIRFGHDHQILICNDNPYGFILNDHQMSLLQVDGAKETAFELNSLSKSHNMAGWRVGMVAGKAENINTVLRFKSNMDSGMFKPVQLAAVKALALPRSWYTNLNATYRKRRQKVFQLLDSLNCTYDEDQVGLFVWAKIPADYSSGYELSDKVLYDSNVFITPGGIFGSNGNSYVRVSLCSTVENLTDAVERVSKQVLSKV